jgi:hypothetical protein|tara:strand:+ start:1504 stop:1653 length:150 start_codon:yes stop_codon:yes gene_type:complete
VIIEVMNTFNLFEYEYLLAAFNKTVKVSNLPETEFLGDIQNVLGRLKHE